MIERLLVIEPELNNSLQRLKAGDQSAFDLIFSKYYRYLVSIAYNYVNESEVAKDLTQDVFLDLWKRRESISIDQSIKFFLRRAVINRCLATKRKSDRITSADNNELIIVDNRLNDSTNEVVAYNDLQKKVDDIIHKLPDACRRVYKLSRQKHLSHKEIAEKLSISTKTIENQMTKALKTLRVGLKEAGFVSILSILFTSL